MERLVALMDATVPAPGKRRLLAAFMDEAMLAPYLENLPAESSLALCSCAEPARASRHFLPASADLVPGDEGAIEGDGVDAYLEVIKQQPHFANSPVPVRVSSIPVERLTTIQSFLEGDRIRDLRDTTSLSVLRFCIPPGTAVVHVREVVGNRYVLLDGYHRVARLVALGMTHVPAIVVEVHHLRQAVPPIRDGVFSVQMLENEKRPPMLMDFFRPALFCDVTWRR